MYRDLMTEKARSVGSESILAMVLIIVMVTAGAGFVAKSIHDSLTQTAERIESALQVQP